MWIVSSGPTFVIRLRWQGVNRNIRVLLKNGLSLGIPAEIPFFDTDAKIILQTVGRARMEI
jgi:hypothetical protein